MDYTEINEDDKALLDRSPAHAPIVLADDSDPADVKMSIRGLESDHYRLTTRLAAVEENIAQLRDQLSD
jgi:hypothetical protein